jgi:hypothetical protein
LEELATLRSQPGQRGFQAQGWDGSNTTHPISHEQGGAVRGPCKGVSAAEALYLVYTGFCPHVPELGDAVIADAAQLRILDRIECYLFDSRRMTLEFRRKADVGFLGIPYGRT